MILEGVRVIDWGILHAGPGCASMLGDLGADVIKVEERGVGDPVRGQSGSRGVKLKLPGGRHAFFEDWNRNKRGIALDLKKPRGRDIMYRLVQKSDVFVTNFRNDAINRLKMDYETLRKYNDRLIYGHTSAFGERGPDAARPGIELMGYASSGIMMASGEEGMPPIQIAPGVGDRAAAIYLCCGVLAALYDRERQGVGQKVITSQMGSLIALQTSSIVAQLLTGEPYPRLKRTESKNPIYNYYKTGDDKWIAFGNSEADRYWPTFCKGLGMPELEHDPRFETAAKRTENCKELIRLFDGVFATRDRDEWLEMFKKAGDSIYSRVNAIADLPTEPQVIENEFIIDYEHPTLGNVKFLGFPIELSRHTSAITRCAPELGQHTEEVLLEYGYTWDDISQLKDEEVI
ncbi:MAG: CoA transferase [Chloroflexi bacterium]|nr:CoA transferase [Chloroflexota bacterium]